MLGTVLIAIKVVRTVSFGDDIIISAADSRTRMSQKKIYLFQYLMKALEALKNYIQLRSLLNSNAGMN